MADLEREITRAPIGASVGVGERLYVRTSDAVRPWAPDNGGESLATARLLTLVREEREAQRMTRPPSRGNVPPDLFDDLLQRAPDDLPKRAANINLDRLDTVDGVKRELVEVARAFAPEIEASRRGAITFAETRRLADEVGISEERMREVVRGEAWNAEHLLAARRLLVASAERLHGLHEQVAGGSDENLALFAQALQRHAGLQKTVSGLVAEAGRALSQQRIVARSTEGYRRVLEALGGREITEDIAQKIGRMDPTQIQQLNQFVRRAVDPTWRDKLYEAWISALLSGPKTHLVNMTSNLVAAVEKGTIERATTGAIDWLRARMTGTPQERFAGEAIAEMYGVAQGIADGARFATEAWATEQPQFGGLHVEGRRGAIGGKTGRLIRIPLRALTAEDEFFKGLAFRMALHGLAYRQAAREGVPADARVRRMVELTNDPSTDLVEQAQQEAAVRTFTQDPGTTVQMFMRLRNRIPGASVVVPFVRTPFNIIRYALERTPAGFVPVFAKAGWLGKGLAPEVPLKGGALSEEFAKPIVGTLFMTGIALLAAAGYVTGSGPEDPRDKDALRATGWQPYSFRLGDVYVGYGRLEPVGTIFGMGADASELWDEMTEDRRRKLLEAASSVVLENLVNKTFLRGVRDASRAVADPERYAASWIEGLAGTLVPTGVAQVGRMLDPTLRRREGVAEALTARLPFASTSLAPRRDMWGRPITATGAERLSTVLPLDLRWAKRDPAALEVLRLGLRVGRPQRRIGNLELTVAEHDRYVEAAGRRTRDAILREMDSPAYLRRTELGKHDRLRKVIDDARRDARDEVLRDIPVADRTERRSERSPGSSPRACASRRLHDPEMRHVTNHGQSGSQDVGCDRGDRHDHRRGWPDEHLRHWPGLRCEEGTAGREEGIADRPQGELADAARR